MQYNSDQYCAGTMHAVKCSVVQCSEVHGTPEVEGVYLTVYPELSPNTDSISF